MQFPNAFQVSTALQTKVSHINHTENPQIKHHTCVHAHNHDRICKCSNSRMLPTLMQNIEVLKQSSVLVVGKAVGAAIRLSNVFSARGHKKLLTV